MLRIILFVGALLLPLVALVYYAEASLFIDDTSTVDKGHFELEFSADYYRDEENELDPETEEYTRQVYKETDLSSYAAFGITERWDTSVTFPYQFIDDSTSGKVNGASDIIFDTKYRLREESNFLPSFAFYFALKADNANEEKSLGTGRKDYSINNIFTKEIGENAFDLNLGYVFVGGKADNLFYSALDWTYYFTKKISFCNEIYSETTFRGGFDNNYFCYGLSADYNMNELLCFELGLGIGISKVSPDYQFSGSVTFDF